MGQKYITAVEAMLVARGIAASNGVSVKLGRTNAAYTDGKTITVPNAELYTANGMDFLRGYLDHECGHVRFTDMERWDSFTKNGDQQDLHRIYNVFEDARIERLMGEVFRGSAANIRRLNDLLFGDAERQEHYLQSVKNSMEDSTGNITNAGSLVASALLNYILIRQYELRYGRDYGSAAIRTAMCQRAQALVKNYSWSDFTDSYGEDGAGFERALRSSFDHADDLARRAGETRTQDEVEQLVLEAQALMTEFMRDMSEGIADSLQDLAESLTGQPQEGSGSDGDGQGSSSGDGQDQSEDGGQGSSSGDAQEAAEHARESAESWREAAEIAQQLLDEQQGRAQPGSDLTAESLRMTFNGHAGWNNELTDKHAQIANEIYQDSSRVRGSLTREERNALDSAMRLSYEMSESQIRKGKKWGDRLRPRELRDINTMVTQLGARLRSLLQSVTYIRGSTGQVGTHLDGRVLYRPALGDGRIFHRRAERLAHNTEAIVVLDGSSSMGWEGGVMLQATMAAVSMLGALRSLPHTRAALYTFEGGGFLPLSDWHEPLPNVLIDANGGTPIGAVLINCLSLFNMAKDTRRMVFVFSDGEPDNPACVREAYRTLERSGIEVYGIGIGYDNFKSWGLPEENTLGSTDISQLPDIVTTLLQRAVKRAGHR